MQKASKILLWISLGIGLLHVIATVIAALIGGAATPVGTANGTVHITGILLYHIVRTVLPLVGKLLFVIIILFTLKSKSENIIAEIFAIILFAGGGTLLMNVASAGMINIIIANMGSEALGIYAYMNTGASWVSFLYNISNTLFLVGVSFAIAYKKVELADIRRMLEEEDV